MTRTFVSFETLRKNAPVISPVYQDFKNRADELLEKRKGTVTGFELDLIIDRVIIEKCKSQEEYKLADAFFDNYLNAWSTEGRVAAELFAHALGVSA